jgi:hypothetical protein
MPGPQFKPCRQAARTNVSSTPHSPENPYSTPVRTIDRMNLPPPVRKENRRIQRISLPLPCRVEVKLDKENGWNAITRLSDVSAFGAGFTLDRPIKRGRLVHLTTPMPRQLRSFDYSEPQYRIWCIVRRCISIGDSLHRPEYSIGVAFVGKTPPPSYLEHPGMLYDVADKGDADGTLYRLVPADMFADDSGLPQELRKQTRYQIPESLVLEKVDETGNVLASESTVTENISLGGAAVFTTLEVEAGTFLRVTSPRFGVTILSIVRGKRSGHDGITRLHLEFIDRFFPLEGIVSGP